MSRGGSGMGMGINKRFNGRVDKPNGRSKSSLDEQQLKRVHWNLEQIAPLKKNFYRPNDVQRSRTEVEAYLRKNEVTVNGRNVPETILDFNEVGFPSYITSEMVRQGFKEPTIIQAQGWPVALSGRDLVCISFFFVLTVNS